MTDNGAEQSKREQGPPGPSLVPDQPIKSSVQDQLGRGEFASRLAQQLLDYEDPSCLVLALYGPWGSGKSSLLNLLDKELAAGKTHESPPIVVQFDPWNFSNLDQLIAMFFGELEMRVRHSEPRFAKHIEKGLRALSAILAPAELVPVGGPYFAVASRMVKGVADNFRKNKKSLIDIKETINTEFRQCGRRIFVLIDDID